MTNSMYSLFSAIICVILSVIFLTDTMTNSMYSLFSAIICVILSVIFLTFLYIKGKRDYSHGEDVTVSAAEIRAALEELRVEIEEEKRRLRNEQRRNSAPLESSSYTQPIEYSDFIRGIDIANHTSYHVAGTLGFNYAGSSQIELFNTYIGEPIRVDLDENNNQQVVRNNIDIKRENGCNKKENAERPKRRLDVDTKDI